MVERDVRQRSVIGTVVGSDTLSHVDIGDSQTPFDTDDCSDMTIQRLDELVNILYRVGELQEIDVGDMGGAEKVVEDSAAVVVELSVDMESDRKRLVCSTDGTRIAPP